MSYTDSEIAVHAENYQAGRVAHAFYERHEQALLAYGKKCGAEDLAREVLVDALVEWWRERRAGAQMQPPLAVSWYRASSRGPLRAYLQRCIKTRAADRRHAASRTDSLDDDAPGRPRTPAVAAATPRPDPARLQRACECQAAAVRATAARQPQAALGWWLVALCGRQAKALQKLLYPARGVLTGRGPEWRENPGTINRLVAQFERERARQLEAARQSAGLTADDLDQAVEMYGTCLAWGELPRRAGRAAVTKAERSRLAEFAGGLPPAGRKEMIAWLIGRPDAVRQLALFLPAQGTRDRGPEVDPAAVGETLALPADPLLAGRRGTFHTEARQRSRSMGPAELLGKLGPTVARVFEYLLSAVGADSGTLWLRQGERLVAVLNSREHDLPGLSVPAHLGFVHQCLREEQAFAVQPKTPRDAARHFAGIDARLGRPIHALMVAPYRQFGGMAGVLTCVRFAAETPPFAPGAVSEAVWFARWAAGLLESRLQHEALRRERALAARLREVLASVGRDCEPAALARGLGLGLSAPGAEASSLSPQILKQLFAWVLAATGADAGTLWLRNGDALEAVLNPHEPAIVGRRQAIREGIIGSVFRRGRAEVTPNVPADTRYEPRVDREVSRHSTRSMITVPFTLFGTRAGVLTLVRQTPDLGPLPASTVKHARLLAVLVQRHFEDALRTRLLDPAPEIEWLEAGPPE